jgi:hypothetical protein
MPGPDRRQVRSKEVRAGGVYRAAGHTHDLNPSAE